MIAYVNVEWMFDLSMKHVTQDQVYSNTRVPTQVNTNQHESDTSPTPVKRINTSLAWDNRNLN